MKPVWIETTITPCAGSGAVLLVQQAYRVRPPYGALILAGSERHQVPFTPDLERRLLQKMAEMRE